MIRVLVALCIGSVLLAGVVCLQALNSLEPASDRPEARLFRVEKRATMARVAEDLEDSGLVRSALSTRLLARWLDLDGRLHVGEYELSPDLSPREILAIVTSGRVKRWPVTIPEGSRVTDVATRLKEAGLADHDAFLAVANDPLIAARLGVPGDSLEGYLYPDTYLLPRGLEPDEIARIMVQQFERVWQDEIALLATDSKLSKSEIVTLASIVEKETAAPAERPLIAAVFLNRLARGMRLETDPTVIYGITDFDGNLRTVHLRDDANPYNTYRIPALPPGPIASPGDEALRAVVAPAESDYLFFVSRNDGSHEFSASYEEHAAAVDRYQRRRRSRAASTAR